MRGLAVEVTGNRELIPDQKSQYGKRALGAGGPSRLVPKCASERREEADARGRRFSSQGEKYRDYFPIANNPGLFARGLDRNRAATLLRLRVAGGPVKAQSDYNLSRAVITLSTKLTASA